MPGGTAASTLSIGKIRRIDIHRIDLYLTLCHPLTAPRRSLFLPHRAVAAVAGSTPRAP
jgi:hypothetical protein